MARFEICIGRCSFCDRSAGRGVRLVGCTGVPARICLRCVSDRLPPTSPNRRAAREAFAGGGSRNAAFGGTGTRDHTSAIAELEESIRATPDEDHVRSRLKLGDLFAKAGRNADASDQYELVADVYARDGFILKATAVCKQILKLDERRRSVYERLADYYTALGLLDDAAECRRAASIVVEEAPRRSAAECSFCKQTEQDPAVICASCLVEARAVLQPN